MNTKDMTSGNPTPLIIKFALPLMAGNLFQELYTVADTIIVGQFLGVQALAAVGSGGWISWMLLSAVQGFTQGFSIPSAQAYGAKDYSQIRKCMANSAILSFLLSIILLVFGQFILEPILVLMDTPIEILDQALLYLRIYYLGCPIMMLYNYAASHLRAFGNSKVPLYAMIFASFTNIILDIVFVGPLKMGIAGAVIATVLAQLFASFYSMWHLLHIDFLTFSKTDFKFDYQLSKKLLYLGIPMAFQNITISIGGIIVQAIMNQFGIIFIAGVTATNRLYGLIETAAVSYGYAVTTYVGQNLGAAKHKRIIDGVKAAQLIGLFTSFLIGGLMIVFGKNVLSLFISGTPEEIISTMQVAYRYLFIMSASLPILYCLHILRSAIIGLGNSTIPLLTGFAELIMRVGASLIIPIYFSEMNIFFSEPLAWLGSVVVLVIGYFVLTKDFKKFI